MEDMEFGRELIVFQTVGQLRELLKIIPTTHRWQSVVLPAFCIWTKTPTLFFWKQWIAAVMKC